MRLYTLIIILAIIVSSCIVLTYFLRMPLFRRDNIEFSDVYKLKNMLLSEGKITINVKATIKIVNEYIDISGLRIKVTRVYMLFHACNAPSITSEITDLIGVYANQTFIGLVTGLKIIEYASRYVDIIFVNSSLSGKVGTLRLGKQYVVEKILPLWNGQIKYHNSTLFSWQGLRIVRIITLFLEDD
ncbi:MAG: hypothetical protein DRJ64_06025 [Thermoprotei archaeon]|nr:MAG: hypothetical protein DRJ64_06025 [Thermoprotei archaeon]